MKTCFKCNINKPLIEFYKHPRGANGTVNKCKVCNLKDIKISSRNIIKNCFICKKKFGTCKSEIKRGGGKTCSRKCYFERLRKIIKKEEKSAGWKGNKVGKSALHNWVEKHLGKPKQCSVCMTTTHTHYDWANISRKYKRHLSDWKRMCRKCHSKYDYKIRLKKWKKSMRKRTELI